MLQKLWITSEVFYIFLKIKRWVGIFILEPKLATHEGQIVGDVYLAGLYWHVESSAYYALGCLKGALYIMLLNIKRGVSFLFERPNTNCGKCTKRWVLTKNHNCCKIKILASRVLSGGGTTRRVPGPGFFDCVQCYQLVYHFHISAICQVQARVNVVLSKFKDKTKQVELFWTTAENPGSAFRLISL